MRDLLKAYVNSGASFLIFYELSRLLTIFIEILTLYTTSKTSYFVLNTNNLTAFIYYYREYAATVFTTPQSKAYKMKFVSKYFCNRIITSRHVAM